MFIGTLIERAREVQQQWAAFETPPPTPHSHQKNSIDMTDLYGQIRDDEITFMESSSNAIDPALLLEGKEEGQAKRQQRDLGPLLPDHFREALRRYRRDGEGGATGLTGLSVGLGVPGSGAARLQGRRLFK